jgi:hypothetical protein
MMDRMPHERAWLAVVLVAFAVFGLWFTAFLVSWDAEWGYLFLGDLAIHGKIRLYQDEMLGERLPLPFYAMGLSQVIAGPNLWTARLTSLAFAVLAAWATFALGRRLGGPAAGFIALLLLVTHGMVVGYYAAGSYFAFCALLITAGVWAIASGRPLLGMACYTMLALSRANLGVMAPVILVYLILEAPDLRRRLALTLVGLGPVLIFFAWSSEHWKMLAYVPLVSRFVEPFGYRSVFALGGEALAPDPHWADLLVVFGKKYVFWLAAAAAIAAGWALSRSRPELRELRPPRLLLLVGGLAAYALLFQAAILRRYPASVPGWATSFAPLWAVVLGWAAAPLLQRGRTSPAVRIGVAAVLLAVLLVSPARARHPSMPIVPPPVPVPTALAQQARALRSVVPSGSRVFLVGASIVPYMAGVSPYLQQIIHPWTLVPSTDAWVVARSGLWGPRDIEAWLGRDAPYVIIMPAIMQSWYVPVESYRPMVYQIERLLDRHFELIATVGGTPAAPDFRIYRRRGTAL